MSPEVSASRSFTDSELAHELGRYAGDGRSDGAGSAEPVGLLVVADLPREIALIANLFYLMDLSL